jgi:hypothetical protein
VKQAVEMTAYGKPGKRYDRFPPFPQALEIKNDFHITIATTNTSTEQFFYLEFTRNYPNYRDQHNPAPADRLI